MRYLGLDLGSRTLGMSLSDRGGILATSYKTIRHNEEYEKLLKDVILEIKENNIEGIVLGFPKNMDNSIGIKGQLSIEFKAKLEELIDIPVYLEDERLTTKIATDFLIGANVSRKKRKGVVDSLAATVILQAFLDKRRNNEEK